MAYPIIRTWDGNERPSGFNRLYGRLLYGVAHGRSNDTLGMAGATADWLHDNSDAFAVAAVARGDAGIPATQASFVATRNSARARAQLEAGRAWHVADYHEHGLFLPDHSLYANIRRHGASSCPTASFVARSAICSTPLS